MITQVIIKRLNVFYWNVSILFLKINNAESLQEVAENNFDFFTVRNIKIGEHFNLNNSL